MNKPEARHPGEPSLRSRRPAGGVAGGRSDRTDHVGLWSLLALRDLKLDSLPLFKRAVAVHLDRAVVDEDVRTVLDRDEAVPLLRVEPLDGALSHPNSLLPGSQARTARARVVSLPAPHGLFCERSCGFGWHA